MPKTIIITGASSGIGRALSIHLASLKYHVIAVARNQEALEQLQQLYPVNIKIVIADITKIEDRLKIKNALCPEEVGVYLIHNAGIASPKLLADISEEEWDQHYLVNLKAPVFLTQLLLPHLKNGGRVLNISTGLAHKPMAAMSAYGISKSALFMLKEYFNVESKENNIVFSSAMPGVVDSPLQEKMRSSNSKIFPSVDLFKGFFLRGELLDTATVAKFLAWLLLNVESAEFTKDDWDIYDTSHHAKWAKPGEVTPRQVVPEKNPASFFISKKSYLTAGVIAVLGVMVAMLLKK